MSTDARKCSGSPGNSPDGSGSTAIDPRLRQPGTTVAAMGASGAKEQAVPGPALRDDFHFREVMQQFVDEFASCSTYWYVPKARTINDDNVEVIRDILIQIEDAYLEVEWSRETQDALLTDLIQHGVLTPRAEGSIQDRTALIRIWIALLHFLGLAWVEDQQEVVLTEAGRALIESDDPRPVVEAQIAKIQYPAPWSSTADVHDFKGILPQLFLLQVLRECGYELSTDEYVLFVNLAQSHDDLDRIVTYIHTWRDLSDEERYELQQQVLQLPIALPSDDPPTLAGMPQPTTGPRWRRVSLNSSYQLAAFTYVQFLLRADGITAIGHDELDYVVEAHASDLAIPRFRSHEEWVLYFGDPEQRPSWYVYLATELANADKPDEVEPLLAAHGGKLSGEEQEEIQRQQVEKAIEDFYVQNLGLLEPGLELHDDGRQFVTPIGRMDLLCRDPDGAYVVVEIKADEAKDSVFGQILRYIGWVHRNLPDGRDNVRGVILAGGFGEQAKYSRVGLLRNDYRQFLKFVEHIGTTHTV